MAVFNPGSPNISSVYDNVQHALEQSAAIAGKNTGVLGTLNAAVNPIVTEAQRIQEEKSKRELLQFKNSLDDQLAQHQATYTAEADGRMATTQEDIDNVWKQHNLPPEAKPTIKGKVFISPADQTKMVDEAHQHVQINALADEVETTNPKRAKAIRALATTGNKDAETIRKIAFPEDDTPKVQYKTLSDGNTYPVLNGTVVGPALKTTDSSTVISDYPTLQKTSPKSAKDLDAIQTSFNKDPETRKATAKLHALNSLENALKGDSVNPNEVTNIRAELAQAVGNVPGGRFSSTLLQNEGYSKAVADRLEQWLETGATGGLSETNRKNDLKQVQDNKALVKKQLQESVDGSSKLAVSKIKNLNPEFAKKYIGSTVQHFLEQSPEEYLISIGANITPSNIEWAKGKVSNGSK